MDSTSSKPRINGSMLSRMIGQYVCVVGKNLGVSFVWLALNDIIFQSTLVALPVCISLYPTD